MITEDYVSFETAKLLKKKGFDVYGDGSFGSSIKVWMEYSPFGKIRDISTATPSVKGFPAPTLQMAMKWIREVGNLFIEIDYDSYETEDSDSVTTQIGYSFSLQKKEKPNKYEYIHDWVYDTYEEAAEEAIKYCLINYVK